MKTSARNSLPGVIQAVVAGAVNAEVTLRLTGGDEIVSVVTMESVRDLGLELGVPATALIKSSFVILAPGTQRLRTSARNCLSGGEKQRVALGRALLTQPKLLLMDEPLSSLDAAAKAEILPYLERLHTTLAIPALYVSHDAAEVARLADHVLVMREGKIVEGAADDRPTAEERLAAMNAAERDALALAALRSGLYPSPSRGEGQG